MALTPADILRISEPVEAIYTRTVDELLINIARHFNVKGWERTRYWEIKKLSEMGALTEESVKIIARNTGKLPEEIEAARARKLRYVGTEVLFTEDTSPFADPAFIEAQHREGLLVWCNAIVYNYRSVLAGGHSDDRSVLGDPEGGWGWIADRGYDLMQTDHVLESVLYLEKTNRLKRSKSC